MYNTKDKDVQFMVHCFRIESVVFRGTEEEVLQGNEDVRKKYKAMYKRFDKFDFD